MLWLQTNIYCIVKVHQKVGRERERDDMQQRGTGQTRTLAAALRPVVIVHPLS